MSDKYQKVVDAMMDNSVLSSVTCEKLTSVAFKVLGLPEWTTVEFEDLGGGTLTLKRLEDGISFTGAAALSRHQLLDLMEYVGDFR